jgi:transposase
MADVASRTGLWFWHDMLATPARLACRRGLGSDALRAPELALPRRRHRLVRAIVDSCSVRAVYGGTRTGPNPTDRAKRGSKRHLICDARGVPLAVRLTGANRNDSQEALALVDAVPPLQGERGRPRHRPDCVVGDRGYDAVGIRHGLRTRSILPVLAMRRTAHGSGLGRWRWVVERTFAWLNQFRRLRVRYDKRADIHTAFLSLGCAVICWNALRTRWAIG